MAGLECHQQLDTGKLFCRCPSVLREDKPDITFKRKLRAVASELGEFDRAALEAFGKGQTYIYQAYEGCTCLIEADEEPPKPADKEALETILKVALMSKAQIVDEAFVMRKAVIDGSNTSGFQKTMLVAIGGELELSNKKVGILTMALEEDAARPMEKSQGEIVYRLDRLGIPLIELATAPDLKTPEEVKECAQKIGELFRRTCRAKRGLGSIRQDVNISIAKGARVEIKGVQDLSLIDEYVRREAQRQLSLVELKEEMRKRKIGEKELDDFEVADLGQIFAGSECKFLKGKPVFGIKLYKMQGLLGKEIQPGRRFGTELASYVKAKAGLKGIVHSDELPAYEISEREIEQVRHKCDCIMNDAFVLVQAEREKAEKALKVVVERSKQALIGVPEETRDALEDANTEYSRPLPGAARMYPETDLEPVKIEEKHLKELKKELPLTVSEREKLYKEKGLSTNLVSGMRLSNYACFFEHLLKKGVSATTAATLLLEGVKQLSREGATGIRNEMVEEILLAEKKGEITKDVLVNALREWSKQPEKSLAEVLKELKVEKVEEGTVEKVIAGIVEKNSKLVKEKGMHALGALMGDAMKELRGKVDGGTISKLLKQELEKKVKK
ncbi:MAG: Glu-tRNA(Gln) amidotransferase subunit GatE [Candidatus Diapherotrites archaeon]|uniref:Glutamyl-tRNA(Gln) amidotransferase subunit E n=1 Tax=Candidatus Iainarchaeum sp. TaxID=3101447 RepID=A0A938YVW3_9ARCH|nr:Glu-tRNA(Gln) amidotransferase subunit GatE [Candidatus Diapherotrites archaeon]